MRALDLGRPLPFRTARKYLIRPTKLRTLICTKAYLDAEDFSNETYGYMRSRRSTFHNNRQIPASILLHQRLSSVLVWTAKQAVFVVYYLDVSL